MSGHDHNDILSLWELAHAILFDTACRAVNLSESRGGGQAHTSHKGWAIDFRGFATEEENYVLTQCILNRPAKDAHGAAIRFIRRVPDEMVDTGYHLRGVLFGY